VATQTDKPELLADGQLDRATDPEYAAVSALAAWGFVLSLGGVVAFLVVPLVAIPVAGALLCLWGHRHVHRSQGALTGRRLALAGIAVGTVVALAAGLYHFQNWRQEQQTLGSIETQAYDVLDQLLAGKYEEVLARMPVDFRVRQAPDGAEGLKARLGPFFKGAGSVTGRRLLSLRPVQSKEGHWLAPAQMRVDLEHRGLDFNFWFMQMPKGTWDLVGIEAAESFESVTQNPASQAPEPMPSPIHTEHSHEH
jgi:hypothetical protein